MESSTGFCSCCARYSDEYIGEQNLIEDGKEIKELFPLIVKDIALNEEKDNSLCPSFMKPLSISSILIQSDLMIKKSLTSSMEEQKVEAIKESCPTEEPITTKTTPEVKEEVVQSETVKYDEEIKRTKEEPRKTIAKERHNKKFTHEEDEKLKELVKTYGEGAWSCIAEKMEGRNRKQVRERYINFLKKERVVSEFTSKEDAIILQHVHKKGRKWSEIAELLVGRTPIMIKNRYYAKLRKIAKAEEKNKLKDNLVSVLKSDVTSSLSTSQADSLNGEASSTETGTSKNSFKGNRKTSKESFKLEYDDEIERLKVQEKNMKAALAELRERIEKLKANKYDNAISN